MKLTTESPQEQVHSPATEPGRRITREMVESELEAILASRYFKNAVRCRQFLTYVVHHKLEGHTELLKERTIGAEVFDRPPDYATGEDPVVRVQAGEVRRRLEQYYQSTDSPLNIELPVGSYSPVFQLKSAGHAPPAQPILPQPAARRKRGLWLFLAALAIFSLAAWVYSVNHRGAPPRTALQQFWSPIFATRQPVIICLAKPVTYRPNESIYRRYSRTHPGTFKTEAERASEPLPLDPDEQISWGDLYVYTDYGVAAGDVYAAVSVSGLLGKLDKPSQLRIGSNYTYEDLRNSPAVVVGAFNNKWTMQLTSNLHFAFIEDNEQYYIQEQGPNGRIWRTKLGPNGETLEDFGIVSRLLDSKSGQFTVTAAGIGPKGTQAAGEFISSESDLQDALRNAPQNWDKRNMEIVIQTTVTDSVAGPPRAVAAYYW